MGTDAVDQALTVGLQNYDLKFILVTFVCPLCAFFINFMVRTHLGMVSSAGSDALLALALFDITVLTSGDAINPLISSPLIQGQKEGVYGILLVASVTIWIASVMFGERKVNAGLTVSDGKPKLTLEAKVIFFAAMLATFIVILAHIGSFTWQETSNA